MTEASLEAHYEEIRARVRAAVDADEWLHVRWWNRHYEGKVNLVDDDGFRVGGERDGWPVDGGYCTWRGTVAVVTDREQLPPDNAWQRLWAEPEESEREPAGATSDAALMLDEFHTHPNCHKETNHPGLRQTLLEEEHAELLEALEQGDRAAIARECADVLYVVYGTAWVYGIDLDAALREVHRAAMDKMRAGVRRADGKIMKPPGFVPPDMSEAVRGEPREAVS